MKDYVNTRRPTDFDRFLKRNEGNIRLWVFIVCMAVLGSVNF